MMKTLGIIGGGQLGKMLALKAKQMDLRVVALDKDPSCPIASLCDELIVGDLYDSEKLLELAKKSDVVTYEIEHTSTDALKNIKLAGFNIKPSPELLALINDKYAQKTHLVNNGIPTSRILGTDEEIRKDEIEKYLPVVQKSRSGGYDGRGVAVLRDVGDKRNILSSPFYFEEYVEIEKELSVLLVRSESGEIAIYPVVEMVFNKSSNILDMLISPARISDETAQKAKEIALRTLESLIPFGAVGVFAIEMFLTKNGEILVNEIAPRVHNSGHHTIESCYTSQFEQHIRAILNLPLGLTTQHSHAVMINLLGEPGYKGTPKIIGVEEVFKTPGAYLHLYGKRLTAPFRKMGHITIVDKDIDSAIEKAKFLKDRVKIISES